MTDGGVVLSLFAMAATITLTKQNAIQSYIDATQKSSNAEHKNLRLARLNSAFANIGNAVVHVVLVIYMMGNSENESEYWKKEKEFGWVEGPVGLAVGFFFFEF